MQGVSGAQAKRAIRVPHYPTTQYGPEAAKRPGPNITARKEQLATYFDGTA